MEPLEGGRVAASDWARLRQAAYVDSLSVIASRRDCSAQFVGAHCWYLLQLSERTFPEGLLPVRRFAI